MKQRRHRSAGLAEAISRTKTITALAGSLGLSVQAVSQWDEVPPERCADVERVTGVPRSELRPDLFGDWPGRKRTAARAAA